MVKLSEESDHVLVFLILRLQLSSADSLVWMSPVSNMRKIFLNLTGNLQDMKPGLTLSSFVIKFCQKTPMTQN
jgi:hypothetical protein